MGAWPDLTEYHEAVQHPLQAFADQGLKKASIELDRFGMPKPATGGNAVVYKATESRETWAIRCFLRPISDHAERYDAISKHLKKARLPYGTQFFFLRNGIQIRGAWFPVVKMEWVEGDLLHRYVEKNVIAAGLAKNAGEIGQHSGVRIVFDDPIVRAIGDVIVVLGIDGDPVGFSEATCDEGLQGGLGVGGGAGH